MPDKAERLAALCEDIWVHTLGRLRRRTFITTISAISYY